MGFYVALGQCAVAYLAAAERWAALSDAEWHVITNCRSRPIRLPNVREYIVRLSITSDLVFNAVPQQRAKQNGQHDDNKFDNHHRPPIVPCLRPFWNQPRLD